MIDIPGELLASQLKFNGEAGRAFVAALPGRVEEFAGRWGLRVDGPSMSGVCALVVPVRRADGAAAVLKLQPVDEETVGEPVALRTWGGDGAVRLLEHDPPTGALLLERLRPGPLPGTRESVLVVARLLARLTAIAAPPGLRRLGGIAHRMLERTPGAVERVSDGEVRRLLADSAAAVREVAGEPGDRLLHWDLHYGNVLAADRADWLAIDPKPLAGDPGFELWPALYNRFDAADVRRRFDAMTDVLGLDRERARAWTLGRFLQNALWEIGGGAGPGERELEIARRLLS